MKKLDKDKVQVRYITCINKCLPDYPTPLDLLYESCVESGDETLFSQAKAENKCGIDVDRYENIVKILLDLGYIEKCGSKYKIIKTLWD